MSPSISQIPGSPKTCKQDAVKENTKKREQRGEPQIEPSPGGFPTDPPKK